jgi:hypothetical protein
LGYLFEKSAVIKVDLMEDAMNWLYKRNYPGAYFYNQAKQAIYKAMVNQGYTPTPPQQTGLSVFKGLGLRFWWLKHFGK